MTCILGNLKILHAKKLSAKKEMCRNLFLEEIPCGVILISNVSGCLWEVRSPVFFNDILAILLQFFENSYLFHLMPTI